MEVFAASTPSPTSGIHTPPTPKHGYSDSWEPFSPRKSARISQRAAVNRTPSPKLSTRNLHHRQPRSPKSARKNHNNFIHTPATSPQKKRLPPMDSARRASGSLTADGTTKAAAALGLNGKVDSRSGNASVSARGGMLPTPAKTPARKHSEQNDKNIQAIARNLFAGEEELVPTPKKKRTKKYTGISMDSFIAEDVEQPIQIFTDSHERIPEVDTSAENPFYGESSAAAPEPVKRRSKRRVAVPGEGAQTVEEAMSREDGLVYTFRGKKIFRKFSQANDEGSVAQSEDQDEHDIGADAGVEARLRRPLTRSAITPRLLFPVDSKDKDHAMSLEDEEAATDIEDHVMVNIDDEDPETPADAVGDAPETPNAPKFAPASPPITGRTTRSGNKGSDEGTPMKPTRGGKRSPFDSWRRVKTAPESHGQKRSGDLLASDIALKRNRA